MTQDFQLYDAPLCRTQSCRSVQDIHLSLSYMTLFEATILRLSCMCLFENPEIKRAH